MNVKKLAAMLTLVGAFNTPILGLEPGTDVSSVPPDSVGKPKTELHTNFAKVYSGNTKLTDIQVAEILADYPIVLSGYQSGAELRSIGNGLLIGGGIGVAGGLFLILNAESTMLLAHNENDFSSGAHKFVIGYSGILLGTLMIDGGIACCIVGNIKIVKSINKYNSPVTRPTGYRTSKVDYRLGLLDNGSMGLRINF